MRHEVGGMIPPAACAGRPYRYIPPRAHHPLLIPNAPMAKTRYPDAIWQGFTVEQRVLELRRTDDPIRQATNLRARRRTTEALRLQAQRHYDLVLAILRDEIIVNA